MLTVFAAPAADTDPSPITSGAGGESQSSWFEDLEEPDQPNNSFAHRDDEALRDEWTEDTIVRLHFMLLDDIRKLADPATPIAEKFEILRWIYTDPEHDRAPFSFASCVRLFGISTHPGLGTLDADDVRVELRRPVVQWICQSLARYPSWVREAFLESPEWVDVLLARNPQLLNEATRAQVVHGDLFVQSHDSSQRSEEVIRQTEGSHTNPSANGERHGPNRLRGTR